ncbi:MAG: cupin [Gemmatimonadales bacterium]|jgi:quercetin dioxygenase-like cupin family protein|nr:cupin [Gemmatimonadales bacterium]
MHVLRFSDADPPAWVSPHITGETRKLVPFDEGAEQVDISFIKFPPGVQCTYHVHPTDQLLIAIDGAGFVETAGGREEFGPGDVVHCPAGERHRHGATEHVHLDQVSIVVARRFAQ